MFLRLFENLQIPQAQVFSSRTRATCFPCQVRWALRVRKRFQESSHFQPFDTNMTHIFSTGKDSNSYTQIQITVQNNYIHKFEQDQQGPIINKCILLDNKIIVERWKPPDRLNASPDWRISFFRGRDAILEQLDKDPIIAHTNKDSKDMRHWKIAKLLVSLIGGMGDIYIYVYSHPITQLFFKSPRNNHWTLIHIATWVLCLMYVIVLLFNTTHNTTDCKIDCCVSTPNIIVW